MEPMSLVFIGVLIMGAGFLVIDTSKKKIDTAAGVALMIISGLFIQKALEILFS